jgi:hypothetical protein
MNISEKLIGHILRSEPFSQKLCRWWDNVGKYAEVRQATDKDMVHVRCMLDK